MRAAAGFDTNQACWLFLEKPQHFALAQLAVQDRGTLGIGAMDLKNLFGQIQPDSGNLLHGTAPTLLAFKQRRRLAHDAAVAGRSTSSNKVRLV